ncbi:MAG: hypothetical protein U0350_44380 [Caldilineaceae bacterium]
MFHRLSVAPRHSALRLGVMLVLSGLLLFALSSAPIVHAQTYDLTTDMIGPTYVQAGQNLTYEVTVKNLTSHAFTNVILSNEVPANVTYVSGGALVNDGANPPYVQITLASLAANATQTVAWVAKANSGLAVGAVINNDGFDISGSTPATTNVGNFGDASTLVEAPGTLVAVYKNANGTPFNVTVNGYQFANYGNDAPRNSSDDLNKTDVFELFGPSVCQSGNTAATCVLSGPAQEWLTKQINGMKGGHCDGMAATSLRLFNSQVYRQYSTPATFQAGAANTANLNFPAQPIENYIAHYFQTQNFIWDSHFVGTPTEIVNKLTQDFNKSPSVGYTIAFFKTNNLTKFDDSDWSLGHAVTPYGIEAVSATEKRILVYDNNFPKQREYFTVNTAANTWRYVTSATPGAGDAVYTGTAVSQNLRLVPISARDLPAGQYFDCPFCNTGTVASAQASTPGLVSGNIEFNYTGEGAILVVNDQNQSTGFAFDTETFINEIPRRDFSLRRRAGQRYPPDQGAVY